MDPLSAGQMSVLDAIAHAEVDRPWIGDQRGGYDETVSGQRFNPDDYARSHPYASGNFRPFWNRRVGLPSTASGRYQETQTTYNDNVKNYGIPGFSREAQDQRAWMKASDLYGGNNAWQRYPGATGDLKADVEKFGSDPKWWSTAAAPALHHEWTSVPGGPEPNDKTYNWISNAVYGFNNGTPGSVSDLPREVSTEELPTEYSEADAPSLVGPYPGGRIPGQPVPPSEQVPGVTYTPTPASVSTKPITGPGLLNTGGTRGPGARSVPTASGGQFGTGVGMLGTGDDKDSSSSDDALLKAFAASQPQMQQPQSAITPRPIQQLPGQQLQPLQIGPHMQLAPPQTQLSMSMSPLSLAIARAAAQRGGGM